MDLKISHYTIITEPVDDDHENCVVFSTRTNNVVVIPLAIIECLQRGEFEQLPDTLIDQLKEIKVVVEKSDDELREIIEENQAYLASEKDHVLYEVIQPSAMCQLGCYYCGQTHTKKNISPDLFDVIVERIRRKAAAGNYKRLFIGWFGGEPLMALGEIRELTKKLKAVAAEFNMSYSGKLVTNGLSLKEKVFEELATQMNITSIEVTIDGAEEYHDSHRYTKQGGKSFSLILGNLQKIINRPDFASLGCKISIRCNVDLKNHEGVVPLMKLLADNNFQNKITFYPIGIYAWGNDAHKGSLTKEEFAKKEILWLIEMIKLGFAVSEVPARVKKVCMAVSQHTEMYDAYGNIFNCSEVSYVPQYKDTEYILGNLAVPEGPAKERPLVNWNDEVLSGKFPCHTCKMLPVCGGACPKSWHEDMRACPSAKFNMADRLKISYAISRSSSLEDRNRKLSELAKVLA